MSIVVGGRTDEVANIMRTRYVLPLLIFSPQRSVWHVLSNMMPLIDQLNRMGHHLLYIEEIVMSQSL